MNSSPQRGKVVDGAHQDSSDRMKAKGRSSMPVGQAPKDLLVNPARDLPQHASYNDSGYLDGSAAYAESEEGLNQSAFALNNGSSFLDEGVAFTTSEGPLAEAQCSETQSTLADHCGSPSPVKINLRQHDGEVVTISQEEFSKLPPEVAGVCYITLYDADWRKLSRRKEQSARDAANAALDMAYTRDEHGRRPGFSAMFGVDWNKEAVYKVWKDVKRAVPRADPLDRVLNWVLSDDVRSYAPDEVGEYAEVFLDLPARGKHFPNPNPAWSVPVLEGYETSISRCASERGTHGHNSPVPVDPHGQKILDIYRQLHNRQANVKDQIVRGVITAETLEQQMMESAGAEDDNPGSELILALDHYLALRRACRTITFVDQMKNELAQNQARGMAASRQFPNGVVYSPQQHPLHHGQPQPVPTVKPYPVHITNPAPFLPQDTPATATTTAMNGGAQNGIYLPQMPHPNFHMDARRSFQPATYASGGLAASDGQVRSSAALGPLKNTRRHKKSGLAAPRQGAMKGGALYTMPYQCLWQRCGHRFKSSAELYTHVERHHILTDPGLLTGERGFSCQWHECAVMQESAGVLGQLAATSTSNLAALGTQKNHGKLRWGQGNGAGRHTWPRKQLSISSKPHSFKARYQLLIHIQNVHCKEKMRLEDHPASSGHVTSKQDKHGWPTAQGQGTDQLSDIAESRSRPGQPPR